MSSSSWQVTAATTAASLAGIALVHYVYNRSVEQRERKQALKLLRKVENIVAEVSVRLMHLENQAEDFAANEEEDDESAQAASDASLNSYYHFDSQGNKLKTKWDNFDVDAELERLEREEAEGEASSSVTKPVAAAAPKRPTQRVSEKTLLNTAAGIEQEFEAVLEFLDDIRGDEYVKQLRKAIVSKITTEQFSRIDRIRTILA